MADVGKRGACPSPSRRASVKDVAKGLFYDSVVADVGAFRVGSGAIYLDFTQQQFVPAEKHLPMKGLVLPSPQMSLRASGYENLDLGVAIMTN